MKYALIFLGLLFNFFLITPIVAAIDSPSPAGKKEEKTVEPYTPPEEKGAQIKTEAGQGVSIEDLMKKTGSQLPSNLPKLDLSEVKDPVSWVEKFFLRYIINPIFLLSGGVAVIMILYSSFRIITARGEEEGLTAAKTTLIWAGAGLGLIMLSYTIINNLIRIFLEKI